MRQHLIARWTIWATVVLAIGALNIGVSAAPLAEDKVTLLDRVKAAQGPVCGAFTEVYWMDFEGKNSASWADQHFRDIVLFTDPCGFHTFYEYEKDSEGKAVVRPSRTAGYPMVAYRPVVDPGRWLDIWLEKVDLYEAARAAYDRIDWYKWRRWRETERKTEHEMVAAALEAAGARFIIQVIDSDPMSQEKDGRWVRLVESGKLQNADRHTVAQLDELLDHQRLILARAFAQNARALGLDPLDPKIDGEELPFLAPGPYEGKCGEIEPCCGRPDPSRGLFVEFHGSMPVPIR